jgi:hypothetical protein
MVVKYVSKEALAPCFGLSFPERNEVHVRADLPGAARAFVLAHEIYHLTDKAQWWVWREIKANAHAFLKHPWGGVVTVALTIFSLDRWRFYFRRIREGF